MHALPRRLSGGWELRQKHRQRHGNSQNDVKMTSAACVEKMSSQDVKYATAKYVDIAKDAAKKKKIASWKKTRCESECATVSVLFCFKMRTTSFCFSMSAFY